MTDASEWRGRVGDIWAQEWQRTDRAFGALSDALNELILDHAPPGPFRALDIGCGAGGTALSLAAARPDAEIVAVDLSPALIEAAEARAGGRPRLSFVVGDAVAMAETRGPFELLMSRHGVMFFPDPPAAFAALHGAASPGATLVFSCFADPESNGFASPLARALGLPAPVAGAAPGPFAFSDPAYVETLLTTAGWGELDHRRIDFPWRAGEGTAPLDDAVAFLSRTGPAAAEMRGADEPRRAELRDGLRRYLATFADEDVVDLPASAWLWSARA